MPESPLPEAPPSPEDLQTRITEALDVAYRYGTIEGAHHKMWVIDQMVRCLTGCPMVTKHAIGASGESYDYEGRGESDAYRTFLETDEDEADWDMGIAP